MSDRQHLSRASSRQEHSSTDLGTDVINPVNIFEMNASNLLSFYESELRMGRTLFDTLPLLDCLVNHNLSLLSIPKLSKLATLISARVETQACVELLAPLCQLAVSLGSNKVTCFHHIIPKAALLLFQFDAALFLCEIGVEVSICCNVREYLLFCFYSALMLLRINNLKLASKFVYACLATPIKDVH
jgi:hypothetical protein